jgi:hypothetical protein
MINDRVNHLRAFGVVGVVAVGPFGVVGAFGVWAGGEMMERD